MSYGFFIVIVVITIIILISLLYIVDVLYDLFSDKFPLPYSNGLVIKSNPGTCHLLITCNENVTVHVGGYEIENTMCEKLVGVKLDWKLNFDDQIWDICKKASGKLNALAKIAPS